ncbi:hypothetical protein ACJ41O_010717 [Fusarium nematophilum]
MVRRNKGQVKGEDSKASPFWGPQQIRLADELLSDFSGGNGNFEDHPHLPRIQELTVRHVQGQQSAGQVYGLLGMANAAAQKRGASISTIKVDYASTLADVYTAATKTILEDCNHLGFISAASVIVRGDGDGLELTPGLPSWVPDFCTSASIAKTRPLLFRQGSSKASWDATRHAELGSLGFRIRGRQLDVKAVWVGTLLAGPSLVNEEFLLTFEPLAAVLLRCGQRYKPTGELSVEAFWRTLIAYSEQNAPSDYDASELRTAFRCWVSGFIINSALECSRPERGWLATYHSMEHFRALAERDGDAAGDLLPDPDWIVAKLREMHSLGYPDTRHFPSMSEHELGRVVKLSKELTTINRLSVRCSTLLDTFAMGRGVFLTDEGHLGMGVPSVAEGDSLWVVSSCPVPLVLRAEVDGSYQLIGDSYVHGVMHGEAIDGAEWQDICIT